MGLGSSLGSTYYLLLSNLWELLLCCLLCCAMLVDVDWVSVSMIDVRLLINGLFKVAT